MQRNARTVVKVYMSISSYPAFHREECDFDKKTVGFGCKVGFVLRTSIIIIILKKKNKKKTCQQLSAILRHLSIFLKMLRVLILHVYVIKMKQKKKMSSRGILVSVQLRLILTDNNK